MRAKKIISKTEGVNFLFFLCFAVSSQMEISPNFLVWKFFKNAVTAEFREKHFPGQHKFIITTGFSCKRKILKLKVALTFRVNMRSVQPPSNPTNKIFYNFQSLLIAKMYFTLESKVLNNLNPKCSFTSCTKPHFPSLVQIPRSVVCGF